MIQHPVTWPGGARCAVCLSFDMDADSLIHHHHPVDGHRRVAAISMLQYGPEVAVPRIVETYRQLGIRQTFFVPAWCIEHYPRAVTHILEGGHELAHHGYIHENPLAQSAEGEAHWLDAGVEMIRRVSGRGPRGWRAPLSNFTDRSLDLLISRGFTYDTSLMGDDVPYVLQSRNTGRQLIEVPVHWGVDDWPQYVQSFDLDYMMPIRAPREGFRIFEQEFASALHHGGLFVPVLHPFVVGRLARWDVFVEFLGRLRERGDVWFAPLEDIAAHVRAEADAGRHAPRVSVIPQYEGPAPRRYAPS